MPSRDKNLGSQALTLKKMGPFQSLSDSTLNLLGSVSIRKKFKANDLIWQMGDPGEYVAIIISGFVEISRFMPVEGENILGIFGPSDIIGLSAVLKKTSYPGTARVSSPNAEIIKIYLKSKLQSLKSPNFELQLWTQDMHLKHEQILFNKIDILNAGNVENRIFELLKQLGSRFGIQENPSGYTIPIGLTRNQVARITNSTVETVIRIISSWQKENLVHWSKSEIFISDIPLLNKKFHLMNNSRYLENMI